MSIDPTQPIPLYYQLKTLLLEEILSGRYGSGRPAADRARALQAVRDQQDAGHPRAVGARGGGRHPPASAARHLRQSSLAPPAARSTRGAGRGVGGTVGRSHPRRRPRRDPGQPDHGPAALAAPGADARGRRGAGAGPRDSRLGLDPGVRRRRLPAPARRPRRGLAPQASTTTTSSSRSWRRTATTAARSASRRSRTSQGSGTAGARSSRSAFRRRERGRSSEPSAARPRENGSPHPIVMTGGSKGGETTAYCLIAFLESNGAHVLSPEGVTLDSRATAQALRFLRSLIDEGLMSSDGARLRVDEAGAAARRGKGGDQLRRQLRDANARGGARRAARRAVGSRRLHARPRRAGRRAGDRRRNDELRHLPAGAAARPGDAPAAAGSGARGACTRRARDRAHPGAAARRSR